MRKRITAGQRHSPRKERPAPARRGPPTKAVKVPRSSASSLRAAPVSNPNSVRLNRFLSQCGVASRRKADEMISSGKVTVNGETVRELGVCINPKLDRVKVRNRSISLPHRGAVVFYKPRGVVSTLSDPEGRPSLSDYLTKNYVSYFPVGRLDYDSSGLIILTNDGDLAERLLHPRFGHERTYLVRAEGSVSQGTLDKLAKGVRLKDGMVKANAKFVPPPADARRAGARAPEEKSTWLEITVIEGRNRLVRRMMDEVRHSVIKLRRIAHGPFKLGKLKPGQMRQLTEKEFEKIRESVMGFDPSTKDTKRT